MLLTYIRYPGLSISGSQLLNKSDSWCHHLLASWPLASSLTSLCLSFLISEMRMNNNNIDHTWWYDNWTGSVSLSNMSIEQNWTEGISTLSIQMRMMTFVNDFYLLRLCLGPLLLLHLNLVCILLFCGGFFGAVNNVWASHYFIFLPPPKGKDSSAQINPNPVSFLPGSQFSG